MRKLVTISLLALALSPLAVQGGEVPFPGKAEPTPTPPATTCTENCTSTATSLSDIDIEMLIDVMLSLPWP